MRAPVAVLAEIAWRWVFGFAFWAILYYSFREYFASVEISNAEYAMMRSFEPYTWLAISARVMLAFGAGLRAMGPIIVPAIAVLWIALATLGRGATVRALAADEPHTNWTSTVGLHFLRVVLTLASVLAYFGCGIVISSFAGDTTDHIALAVMLSTLALLAIVFVWSVMNWLLSLAAIFSVRDGDGIWLSLKKTAELCRTVRNAFVSTGFWFTFARAIVIVSVTFVSAMAFTQFRPRAALLAVVLISLAYFAIADALNLWRLAAYISLTEPEPEPPAVLAPPTPPFQPHTEPEPTTTAVVETEPAAPTIPTDEPAPNSQ